MSQMPRAAPWCSRASSGVGRAGRLEPARRRTAGEGVPVQHHEPVEEAGHRAHDRATSSTAAARSRRSSAKVLVAAAVEARSGTCPWRGSISTMRARRAGGGPGCGRPRSRPDGRWRRPPPAGGAGEVREPGDREGPRPQRPCWRRAWNARSGSADTTSTHRTGRCIRRVRPREPRRPLAAERMMPARPRSTCGGGSRGGRPACGCSAGRCASWGLPPRSVWPGGPAPGMAGHAPSAGARRHGRATTSRRQSRTAGPVGTLHRWGRHIHRNLWKPIP